MHDGVDGERGHDQRRQHLERGGVRHRPLHVTALLLLLVPVIRHVRADVADRNGVRQVHTPALPSQLQNSSTPEA